MREHTCSWLVLSLALVSLAACSGPSASRSADGGARATVDATRPPSYTGDGSVCESVGVSVSPVEPHVLVVLDRSGSMGGERWTVASSAVAGYVQALDDQVAFGLTFFPAPGEELSCGPGRNRVPIAPENGDAIAAALADPAAVAIRDVGYTPTSSTLRDALATLRLVDPDRAASAEFIVLVTDGLPNCRAGAERNADPDEAATYAALDALQAEGVATYVIGYQTAAVAAVMDEMARHGGTERHHAVESAEQLRAALDEITQAIASCEFSWRPRPKTRLRARGDRRRADPRLGRRLHPRGRRGARARRRLRVASRRRRARRAHHRRVRAGRPDLSGVCGGALEHSCPRSQPGGRAAIVDVDARPVERSARSQMSTFER